MITLLLAALISGCSLGKSYTSAKKSGPTETVTKFVKGEVVETTVVEGEKYETKDELFIARVCSWFGISAGETIVNRSGVNIDAKKGQIISGKGELGWLERTYFWIRGVLLWLIGLILLGFGLTFVPGPVGGFFRGLISMLPVVGGYYQKIIKTNETKKIVSSVEVGKDSLDEENRAAFKNALDKEQDKETKKLVKELK